MRGTWQLQLANRDFDYIAAPIPIDQRQVAISDSYVINPSTINEVRLGWNRRKTTRLPSSLGENWASKFGIPNVGRKPCRFSRLQVAASFIFASRKAKRWM